MVERSEQEVVRFDKLKRLREEGFNYPNNHKKYQLANVIIKEQISDPESAPRFSISGRIVQLRLMGKAAFAHIQDSSGKIQVYVRRDAIGEDAFKQFKKYDIGDIVELEGYLFLTKTEEKTLHAENLRLLSKCLIPLPEKWHGLTDVEARYRYRYVDLIANPDVRNIFKTRAGIIKEIRKFLDDRSFVEVETPVLHYVAGGATAKPFETYYNALHTPMNLRIALELPLKKLVVGGLERVYEIGRVFRNEGVSKKHNPEFTMLEFYQAYATYNDLMDTTEELISNLVKQFNGSYQLSYGDKTIDFTPPWPRLTMQESIHEIGGLSRDFNLSDLNGITAAAKAHSVELNEEDWGHALEELYDHLVEDKLINPTFITKHPFSISPLARKNDDNPEVVDRFELIVGGMELANAFSELNDPVDQRERFEAQAARKAGGDEEANDIDEDFLKALEYGLPPTGGEGIGIDRLVMLLTNAPSIRDVLLFPQLKPLSDQATEEELSDNENDSAN